MIKPGSLITYIGSDGITRTERVAATGYRSGRPEIRKRLNRWERFTRRLTPARWRKPIPIIRECQPAQVLMKFTPDSGEEARRLATTLHEMNNGFAQILQVHDETTTQEDA